MNIVEKQSKFASLESEIREIEGSIALKETEIRTLGEQCKTEVRGFTDDEKNLLTSSKLEIRSLESSLENKKEELRLIQIDLDTYIEPIVKESEEKRNITILNNKSMEKRNLMQEILAAQNEKRSVFVQLENKNAINQRTIEQRAGLEATVVGQGIENVPTETTPIIIPTYGQNILERIGVTFINNCVGDIKVPKYSGSKLAFAAENAPSTDAAGTFSELTLKPKRVTGYIDISRRLLEQDNYDVMAKLYQDISESYYAFLQSAIFGAQAGGANSFAGAFNAPAPVAVTDYASFLGVEAGLIAKNFVPKFYLANTTGYEGLRSLEKPSAVVADIHRNDVIGHSIVNNNTVSGVPLLVSNYINPGTPSYILGDFSNLWIANWKNIEIFPDIYSQAQNYYIRLHINADVDAGWVRDSYVTATL